MDQEPNETTVYELIGDVLNPEGDARTRDNILKQPMWLKGTRFRVVEVRYDVLDRSMGAEQPMLSRSVVRQIEFTRTWWRQTHRIPDHDPRFQLLVSNSTYGPETFDEFTERTEVDEWRQDIIRKLVDTGHLTCQRLEELRHEVETDWEREHGENG